MDWLRLIGTKELVYVVCPHCQQRLNLDHDETKVRVRVRVPAKNRDGFLYLSAFWEDYWSSEEGIDIDFGDECEMLCPHCGESFESEHRCEVCGASATLFKFASGAIGICNRKGCRMHLRTPLSLAISAARSVRAPQRWQRLRRPKSSSLFIYAGAPRPGYRAPLEEVDNIIGDRKGDPSQLIEVLQDVQGKFGYLPEEILWEVAERLGVPVIDVFRAASFYKSFSLTPRGKHRLTCCMGTACHVRGSKVVLEEMERRVGVKAGQTTEDLQFTLETVNCVGACALGPVVIADEKYFGRLKPGRVPAILKELSEEAHD